MAFSKPPLSVHEQMELLKSRGLLIPDAGKAAHQLSHTNYYRLRAYWLPFEETDETGTHTFKEGVSWDDIEYLYNFDQQLRILLLDAIGNFEISLRTSWAHYLAIKYGSHAHEQQNIFHNEEKHEEHINQLVYEYANSKETFARHHMAKYPELKTPPIWACCELMTFGELSKWITNLKHLSDKRELLKQYGFNEAVMLSFVRHISVVRNTCAHFSRVWNRRFTFQMSIPARQASLFNTSAPAKIYNAIVMLSLVMNEISPGHDWTERVRELIISHPKINPTSLGFPPDWELLPIWQLSVKEAAATTSPE